MVNYFFLRFINLFIESEVQATEKLYLLIHNYRYKFVYKVSKDSKDWSGSSWPTVTDGYSYKTQKSFSPTLTNTAIIDVLKGKKASIYSGNRTINNVEYLGCRFGKETQYFAIDIDNKPGKENHYYNIETIEKIIEVTKHIGKPVFMRSSYSEGWHLRWYFDKPVLTWNLACYLKDLFESNGFIIEDGKLEVFPNRKATRETNYNALRLPCQKGSALLTLDDARPIATWDEDPEIFLCHWASEVMKKIVDTKNITFISEKQFQNPKTKEWFDQYTELKDKGLTYPGQENTARGIMARSFIRFEGSTDVKELTQKLCDWIDKKHNGFSNDYNTDPRKSHYNCQRSAICTLKSGKYFSPNKTTNKKKINNSNRAKSATYDHILNKYLQEGKISLNMSQMEISRITEISRTVIQRKINTLKIQKASLAF